MNIGLRISRICSFRFERAAAHNEMANKICSNREKSWQQLAQKKTVQSHEIGNDPYLLELFDKKNLSAQI